MTNHDWGQIDVQSDYARFTGQLNGKLSTRQAATFTELLEQKVTEAEKEMREATNKMFFGDIDEATKNLYAKSVTQNIYTKPEFVKRLQEFPTPPQGKAEDMDTIRDAIAEERERVIRKRAKALMKHLTYYFGALEYGEGGIASWSVLFENRDEAYPYAAIKAKSGRWYSTEVKGSVYADDDALIDQLIEWAIEDRLTGFGLTDSVIDE